MAVLACLMPSRSFIDAIASKQFTQKCLSISDGFWKYHQFYSNQRVIWPFWPIRGQFDKSEANLTILTNQIGRSCAMKWQLMFCRMASSQLIWSHCVQKSEIREALKNKYFEGSQIEQLKKSSYILPYPLKWSTWCQMSWNGQNLPIFGLFEGHRCPKMTSFHWAWTWQYLSLVLNFMVSST